MCTADQVQRYRSKISGPLLDRIDLHVEVARPARLQYQKRGKQPEGSAAVRKRVIQARNRQLDRSGGSNAQLDSAGVRQHCQPNRRNRTFLEDAAELMNLSPRAFQRILKVARTVADLEEEDAIRKKHLAEALAYRGFDCEKGRG